MILFELERLKVSITEALHASYRPPQGFSYSAPADSRVSHNLHNLAQAAKRFHSTASSTVSTIRDRAGGSSLGDFSNYRRERLVTFARSAHAHIVTGHEAPAPEVFLAPESASSLRSPAATNVRPLSVPVAASTHQWPSVEDDEEEEAEFEKLFLDGLEDLARDNIRRKEFEKAVKLITQAIQRKDKAGFGKKDLRRLQLLLALCHFFRDDWN
jgi:hypothetical protein